MATVRELDRDVEYMQHILSAGMKPSARGTATVFLERTAMASGSDSRWAHGVLQDEPATRLQPKLTVHSAHRPAIYTDISGTRRIAAGTIHKITMGTATARLPFVVPEGITLAEIAWEPYPPKPSAPRGRNQALEDLGITGEAESRFVTGSKGDTYKVTLNVDTTWSCTCLGYTYRRHCKHLAIAFPELS